MPLAKAVSIAFCKSTINCTATCCNDFFIREKENTAKKNIPENTFTISYLQKKNLINPFLAYENKIIRQYHITPCESIVLNSSFNPRKLFITIKMAGLLTCSLHPSLPFQKMKSDILKGFS